MSEYKGYPLCSICGGIKGSIPIPYPRSIGRCPGHEPAPKHDGKLLIRYGEREFMVRVRQLELVLAPEEALSLFAELEQERETLERLAKEQDSEKQ